MVKFTELATVQAAWHGAAVLGGLTKDKLKKNATEQLYLELKVKKGSN